VIRPLAVIVAAILMSRPSMPSAEATRYARILSAEAKEHRFDPLTAVAIVHFESRWQPFRISADGEDWGLGQIRARFLGACRDDEDPVGSPSAACLAAKRSLLVPENNLRRMAAIITANRELCKAKAGGANLPQWLAGYEGLNRPSSDVWCKPSTKTWEVVAYRRMLVAKLAPVRHAKRIAKRAAKPTKHAASKPGAQATTPKPASAKRRDARPKHRTSARKRR
jgi:hypothetical protein